MHCYTNDSLKSHSINHFVCIFLLICYSTIYLWLHHFCLPYTTHMPCMYYSLHVLLHMRIFLIQAAVLRLIFGVNTTRQYSCCCIWSEICLAPLCCNTTLAVTFFSSNKLCHFLTLYWHRDEIQVCHEIWLICAHCIIRFDSWLTCCTTASFTFRQLWWNPGSYPDQKLAAPRGHTRVEGGFRPPRSTYAILDAPGSRESKNTAPRSRGILNTHGGHTDGFVRFLQRPSEIEEANRTPIRGSTMLLHERRSLTEWRKNISVQILNKIKRTHQ